MSARLPKVRCHQCKYAMGYWPMYVGDDPRKWGTSVCTRLKRRKRVDVLSEYDGCDKGEFSEVEKKRMAKA